MAERPRHYHLLHRHRDINAHVLPLDHLEELKKTNTHEHAYEKSKTKSLIKLSSSTVSCLRPQIPRVELLQKLVNHRILCYVRLVRLLGAAAVLHHHVTDPSVDERALHPFPERELNQMYI